jgi:predicted component of type VI protein secretion system
MSQSESENENISPTTLVEEIIKENPSSEPTTEQTIVTPMNQNVDLILPEQSKEQSEEQTITKTIEETPKEEAKDSPMLFDGDIIIKKNNSPSNWDFMPEFGTVLKQPLYGNMDKNQPKTFNVRWEINNA